MTKETLMKMLEMYSAWLDVANTQLAQSAKMVDFCSKNIAEVVKQLKELE